MGNQEYSNLGLGGIAAYFSRINILMCRAIAMIVVRVIESILRAKEQARNCEDNC